MKNEWRQARHAGHHRGQQVLLAAGLALMLAAPLRAQPAAAAASAPSASKPVQNDQAQHTVLFNQLGFLPSAAKWAVLPDVEAAQFSLVETSSGQTVWQGKLSEPALWPASQTRVRLADFSAWTQAGQYRLRVPGQPDSPAFQIGPEVYAAVSAAALKAFYFNRASIELKPEHAGPWARPAGHPDLTVKVHASAAGPARKEGGLIASPKGWYDAGDYNKYIVNSGITVYTLLAAYEHFPQFFKAQRLNIPESGQGLPDVLAEALWNLEWMLGMQDPSDGGVYHKLSNKGFDGTVMPHQAQAERYVVQKSTAATLDFAAVMATASRVFAGFEAQRPGLSRRMLAAARRAWQWAQAHPDQVYRQPADIHTGDYGDAVLSDEFAWAAAELFISTRDPSYYRALKAPSLDVGVPSWGDVKGLAWVSLAQHRARLPAVADQALIRARIRSQADALLKAWRESAYRISLQREDIHWGSNSVALNQALMLIQDYRLDGRRESLDAAQALFDYVLGRNALGLSMVTGFGVHAARHPHHRPSEADGVEAPVPGFLVGGPNPGQEDAAGCPVAYASREPALSYLDHYCSYASNEVAINWNAPLVYVAAALQALSSPAQKGKQP